MLQERIRRVALAIVVGLGLLSTGCGKGDRVDVFPVSGKITFDGNLMEGGGAISFIPLDSRPGKTAGGTIDDNGNYVLGTYSQHDGSMTGEFRVVINQVTQTEPENNGDGAPAGEAQEIVPRDRQIPEIYSDFNQSPLTARVDASNNEIDFELVRQK